MVFEHDLDANYTTTITRAVGPHTTTSLRGSLPESAPDDTNAIWVAPNGDDGTGTGTQANPLLTIAGGIGKLSAGKPVINVFNNSAGGTTVITDTTALSLPADRHIQANPGEVAILDFEDSLTVGGDNLLNGVTMRANAAFSPSGTGSLLILSTSSALTMENCILDVVAVTDPVATFNDGIMNANAGGLSASTINYNLFRSGGGPCIVAVFTVLGSETVDNNVFIGPAFLETDQPALDYRRTHGSVETWTLDRNLFINWDFIFRDSLPQTVEANQNILELKGCALENCNYISEEVLKATAGTNYYKVTADYCRLAITKGNVKTFSTGTPLGTAQTTVVISNPISTVNPPLYVDFANVTSSADPEDIRLQAKGKATPSGNGRYLLDSPLIDAYDTGGGLEDVNPWDESTVFVDFTWDKSLTLNFPASQYEENLVLVGMQTNEDLLGNSLSDYNGAKFEFTFNFGGGNRYSNTNDLRRLMQLLLDNGSIQFYPQGTTGSLFSDAVAGTLDASASTFAPTIVTGIPMIFPTWKDWILEINDAGTPKKYLISTHDDTTFTLVDILQLGLPSSGGYSFAIRSILTSVRSDSVGASTDLFAEFRYGQARREVDDDETRAYELGGQSIILRAISKIRENTK
jgi:hypothetical protein